MSIYQRQHKVNSPYRARELFQLPDRRLVGLRISGAGTPEALLPNGGFFMSELTAERARELLNYDHNTGSITWKVKKGPKSKGARAGCKNPNGYINISVDGKLYKAHRIAWLIITGSWPVAETDHINGVRDDNRIDNLREATKSLNQQNQRVPRRDNTSGYLGVSWHAAGKAFSAHIRIKGKKLYLGLFTDPAKAHQAYLDAKRQFHVGGTI